MADKNNDKPGRIRFVPTEPSEKAETTPDMTVEKLRTENKKISKGTTSYAVLAGLLVITFFISFFGFMGFDDWSIAYAADAVKRNVSDFFSFATGGVNNRMINLRFYRTIIIVISGMALAVAGAVYKAIFRNTLASPDTFGVQSGGNLGNVLYVMLFSDTIMEGASTELDNVPEIIGDNMQAIMIFFSCFISVIMLSAVASAAGRGRMSSSAIVLTGTIFSAFIGAFVNLAQYQIIMTDADDPRLEIIKKMSLGTFDYAMMLSQLVTMAIGIAICLAVIFIFMNKMNVYALGDEEAVTMGLNIKAFKYVMIIMSTMLVAIVMSYCGHIAFIAFLVPQIARKFSGGDFKKVVINSMFIGGILMLVVYDAAVILKMTDALNVLTTSIGGVVMIMILVGKRGRKDAVITE